MFARNDSFIVLIEMKYFIKLLYILIFLHPNVLLASALDENINKKSLCKKTEKIVFSCNLNEKLVSICLLDENLKYRYGKKLLNLDIEYPKQNTSNIKPFNFSQSESSAQVRIEEISFPIKNYLYVLTITSRSRAYSEATLTVLYGKKNILNLDQFPVFQKTCDDIKKINHGI
jgi:hypothetical protein